jgi:photosystem II stability/assembly factor-like uncharacterized protein
MKKIILLIILNLFLSSIGFSQWQEANNGLYGVGDRGTLQALTVDPITNWVYAITIGGGVFLSTDNGSTWVARNNGLPNLIVFSIAISGSNIFAGTSVGIYLSTDNGSTWVAKNKGIPIIDNSVLSVNSIAISGSNIFVGTTGRGVFLSTDSGSTWVAKNSGLLNFRSVYSIAISGSNIFAGTSVGVFLSTDNGTTWVAKSSGLQGVPVESIAISESNIFAGTDGIGVFLSTDNGSTWVEKNSGLPTKSVNFLANSGSNIFAGTHYKGLWKLILDAHVLSTDTSNIKIYPNPAKDYLIINTENYSLTPDYSIKIIDLHGIIVFETEVTQPSYKINLSSRFSKGVYILQLYDYKYKIKAVKKIVLQ